VLLIVIPLLVFMFRSELQNSKSDRDAVLTLEPNEFITDPTLLKKSILVLTAVVIAFILHSVVHLEPAVVAMIGAGVLVFISGVKPADFTRDIEWETLIFFAGLFIMVGALVEVGALQIAAEYLSDLTGGDASVAATLLVTASALISGVVDNIPYVTSMIPVVEVMENSIPSINNDGLWWALALGADFGGNLTIVGASANVVATGLAYANGHKITFGQFFKYGLPVTFVSIALALPYVLIRYF
jgi:Na+/H+ antiporter NhaD/arsenite permease-like protein